MSYLECSDWTQCTRCGECLVGCPVMRMEREEAKSAITQLIEGELPSRIKNECTFCFNCNRYCPKELRPHELILQRMIEYRGRTPRLLQYLFNGHPPPTLWTDIYNALTDDEQTILQRWSMTPPPSKDILFVGCIGRISCYDIDNSKVLLDLPKFGPPDICCGELAYRLGSWEAYVETVERTLTRFEELNIERMICYCGSCYNYLSDILSKVYGKKLPFKLISLYEWLWEQYREGRLKVQTPLNYRAAVHESCYVSELGPEFAATLRRLYAAAGMQIVELEHHGECNLSCGAVSVIRSLNLAKSILKVQRRKYAELSNSGVREMAVNCPGCYITLGFTRPFFGKKLRYMPDELLQAFGDHLRFPLGRRLPLIYKTVAKRLPALLLAKNIKQPTGRS
ncbi:MAG: (Fe-S)-binding protein [Dethiobacteria bacterium]